MYLILSKSFVYKQFNNNLDVIYIKNLTFMYKDLHPDINLLFKSGTSINEYLYLLFSSFPTSFPTSFQYVSQF